ncbi:TPA: gamma-glutamylcysteine synthetase [Streptococcus suis]|nr:gamma-glutamylcysteine synthetase [Streptococcus suis]
MVEITKFFKEQYFSKIKHNPELFIGVELEYPVVNSNGGMTSIQVAKDLFIFLSKSLNFEIMKLDEEGNPIELMSEAGDVILFEVTYNTVEFALAKASRIQDVEKRLEYYLKHIQDYLRRYDHELQGKGINPNWRKNDYRPVAIGRYKMLMNYLSLSEQFPSLHQFPQYAGFICGNQVQIDVDRDNFLRVINAFNKIEAVKAYLFANSHFELLKDMAISRDYFWEESMHGLIKENVGIYPYDFDSESDYIAYKRQSVIFYVERKGEHYYFLPMSLDKYLAAKEIIAYTLSGDSLLISPQAEDLKTHRSYHYQELTRRGTVEFRSVCTQPFDRTFAPTAFHLGLICNLEQLEGILKDSVFYQEFGKDYKHLRKKFSTNRLSKKEEKAIDLFSKEILKCAYYGLKDRGFGEELYLESILIK